MTTSITRFVRVRIAAWLLGTSISATGAAGTSQISALEVEFEQYLVAHQGPTVRSLGDAAAFRAFAERFSGARLPVEAARARGFAALEALRRSELDAAARDIAAALSAVPGNAPLLRAQLSVVEGQVLERQGRHEPALRAYVRARQLTRQATNGKPAPRNPLEAYATAAFGVRANPKSKDANARLNAAQTALADAYGNLGSSLTDYTKRLSDGQFAIARKYAARMTELELRSRDSDPAIREAARAELVKLRAKQTQEIKDSNTRVALEVIQGKNGAARTGPDSRLQRQLDELFCKESDQDLIEDLGFKTNWSVGTFRDRTLTNTKRPRDTGAVEKLTDIPTVRAWQDATLETSAGGGDQSAALIGDCGNRLLRRIPTAIALRTADPLESDTYLSELTVALSKLEQADNGDGASARALVAPARLALAERALERGDKSAARVQIEALLRDGERKTLVAQPSSPTLRALMMLASLASEAERPRVRSLLERNLAKLEKQLAQDPAGVYRRGVEQAQNSIRSGRGQPEYDEYAGSYRTGEVLLGQVAKQFAPMLSAAAEQTRVVPVLALARGFDWLGDRARADAIRAQFTTPGPGAESRAPMLEAVLHADLAERAERAGNAPLASAEYARSALAWASLLERDRTLTLQTGYETSQPPAVVFDKAVRGAIAQSQVELGFLLAETARSCAEPLVVSPRTAGADGAVLVAKITALEERALADAARKSGKARLELQKAVAAARKQGRPQTAFVSPLATASVRLDALKGRVPERELKELRDAIEAFEDTYQEARSREVHDTERRAAKASAGRAEARLRESGGEDIAAYRTRDQALQRMSQMQAALEVRSPLTFRRFSSAGELRAVLDPSTQLLSYWMGPGEATVFVVTRDGIRATALPGVTLAKLQPLLARAQAGQLDALRALYQDLVAPLRAQLTGKALVIVPDAALSNVPFEALEDGKRYLFQDYVIRRLAHASDLRTGHPAAPIRRVFAGAKPDAPGLARLEGAAREAAAIRQRIPSAPVSVDPNVTEATLIANLRGTGILHLTAHTEIVARDPQYSRFLLAADADSDGALEAREIAQQSLPELELAVLSACDTGSAGTAAGGITLASAFLAAGASSVVATLWPVNDAAGAEFMDRFYSAVGRGVAPAKALDEARLSLVQKPDFSSPKDWAAFVLIGDSQPLLFAPPQR